MLCAVVLTLGGLAAPAAASEVTPCQPGEGNSGRITGVAADGEMTVTASVQIRFCTSVTTPELGLPALASHALRTEEEESGQVLNGSYFGDQMGARDVVVSVGVPTGTIDLCLHFEQTSAHCWDVRVQSDGTMTVGSATIRTRYLAVVRQDPDPGCGNCW